MQIEDAQRDVRRAFLCGSAGQLVTAVLWAGSAACSTWMSPRAGMWFLVVACIFIYPLTRLTLALVGHRVSLEARHPMNALGMQTAFVVPFCLPLVGAATLHNRNWFYPAVMLLVGAHYLPFVFMYGMPEFAVLAGVLIAGAMASVFYLHPPFAAPAWFAAASLFAFAVVAWNRSRREGLV